VKTHLKQPAGHSPGHFHLVIQETIKLLSERQTGVPKTEEHKQAISAAKRRHYLISSILEAVESVHSQEEAPRCYPPPMTSRSAAAPRLLPPSTCSYDGQRHGIRLSKNTTGFLRVQVRGSGVQSEALSV
jgi:hypothetical protein